jgi:hypothetical protein
MAGGRPGAGGHEGGPRWPRRSHHRTAPTTTSTPISSGKNLISASAATNTTAATPINPITTKAINICMPQTYPSDLTQIRAENLVPDMAHRLR